MNEKLQEIEQQRKSALNEQTKMQKKSIPFFILGGISILLIIFDLEITPIFMIIGAILLVVGFVILGVASQRTQPFNQTFKKNVIEMLLKENYDKVSYEPRQSIPLQTFLKTGLTRNPDRWKGEDLVVGEKNGVKFEVSEFHLEDRHVRRDSKGNTYVTYETFFKGRFFIFEFNKNFNKELRIIEKGILSLDFGRKGLSKVETESIAFNKKFNVLTSDDQHAFYIITPVMLEEILRIETLFKGHIGLLFQGNKLYIAINDNKNTLEPNIKVPLTNESLEYYLVDILIMHEIIYAFNLSSDKFMETN